MMPVFVTYYKLQALPSTPLEKTAYIVLPSSFIALHTYPILTILHLKAEIKKKKGSRLPSYKKALDHHYSRSVQLKLKTLFNPHFLFSKISDTPWMRWHENKPGWLTERD